MTTKTMTSTMSSTTVTRSTSPGPDSARGAREAVACAYATARRLVFDTPATEPLTAYQRARLLDLDEAERTLEQWRRQPRLARSVRLAV